MESWKERLNEGKCERGRRGRHIEKKKKDREREKKKYTNQA
jgi:hypothetical protein